MKIESFNLFYEEQYFIPEFSKFSAFDFAIFDDNDNLIGLIEYDGEQHFMVGSGWMTEEKLIYTRAKDLKKNNYCFEQNVPLIRIPFGIDYTLEDLLLETSKFQITKENEKKYYETY